MGKPLLIQLVNASLIDIEADDDVLLISGNNF